MHVDFMRFPALGIVGGVKHNEGALEFDLLEDASRTPDSLP